LREREREKDRNTVCREGESKREKWRERKREGVREREGTQESENDSAHVLTHTGRTATRKRGSEPESERGKKTEQARGCIPLYQHPWKLSRGKNLMEPYSILEPKFSKNAHDKDVPSHPFDAGFSCVGDRRNRNL